MTEQPAVTIEIDMSSAAQVFDAFDKTSVALVVGARRINSLRPVQIVQVMELLHGRHPEIRMRLELPIKPRGSCLLCSNAQEVGACITGDTVQVVYVTVVAVSVVTVTVMPITVVTVLMVTVPVFKWPTPTHATIFSSPDLKSKPRM